MSPQGRRKNPNTPDQGCRARASGRRNGNAALCKEHERTSTPVNNFSGHAGLEYAKAQLHSPISAPIKGCAVPVQRILLRGSTKQHKESHDVRKTDLQSCARRPMAAGNHQNFHHGPGRSSHVLHVGSDGGSAGTTVLSRLSNLTGWFPALRCTQIPCWRRCLPQQLFPTRFPMPPDGPISTTISPATNWPRRLMETSCPGTHPCRPCCPFRVLYTMSSDMNWTADLGNAFLGPTAGCDVCGAENAPASPGLWIFAERPTDDSGRRSVYYDHAGAP